MDSKIYIRRIKKVGGIDVWLVHGDYIRKNIDEEFTNFGQHYRYKKIPKNEFWLDKEASSNERGLFIHNLIIQYESMKKGENYEVALKKATESEKKLREDHKNKTWTKDPEKAHKQLYKSLANKMQVWIVNGKFVRTEFDINFTEGGHHLVYLYVPSNEIWIDDDVVDEERLLIVLHELHEHILMLKGMSYDKAHFESSAMERQCRKDPEMLVPTLESDGW